MAEEIIEEKIIDQDENDDEVAPVQYDITTYGADFPVDGLVKRLVRGDIFIPDFQRDYVWNQTEASRLIESLLLGLPIPGVFLAKENEGNKLLIIDGQQRLKSLQFFYQGFFNPREDKKTKKVFKLLKVQKPFEGLTYEKLSDNDRIKLDDSIIHATIVKQEAPDDENTSIYHIFERLNNGGKKLTPQEIRTAIYYGNFNELIAELNTYADWRELFGPVNSRLKDQELILRFFSVLHNAERYAKPMVEFMNKFNRKYRNPGENFINENRKIFQTTITYIKNAIGRNAFRPEGVLNVSVFEAIAVGVAKIIQAKGEPNPQKFKDINNELLKNQEFLKAISAATSDESVFKERTSIVEKYFSSL